MNISKISFIVTAVAVLLASANVFIHAVRNDNMISSLIILGLVFAFFIFSAVVTGGKKKNKTDNSDQTEE